MCCGSNLSFNDFYFPNCLPDIMNLIQIMKLYTNKKQNKTKDKDKIKPQHIYYYFQ